MLSETKLKEKLQSVARKEFRPPEKDELSAMIPAMLNHIGSTDSELRDDLIYSAFGTWIGDKVLNAGQLRELLPIILDDQHLPYRLGEQPISARGWNRPYRILSVLSFLSDLRGTHGAA